MGRGLGYFTNYPKCVFFILGNEFCERFSYYGLRAILVIYLTEALQFNESDASSIYHAFVFACYFTPLFGAMMADGWLGKYKTILFISVLYAIGNVVMSGTAFPLEEMEVKGKTVKGPSKGGAVTGLMLIAIGTGGIKPCVSAFGGDQFGPDQSRQLGQFFAVFYMSINVGSVMSTIITPILRKIQCFGHDCYPVAFGVPAGLMVLAVLFFVLGTKWYKRHPPKENVIGKLFGCIWRALVNRCRAAKGESRDHWLDYAKGNYPDEFVEDTKAVMRVLFLYIPLPVYYALFEQQGSRWTLQAGQMNGKLGSIYIQQEQIHAVNPTLVIILVPLMETVIFPCLDKLKIPNRPLQRLGAGMFLAATAFIMCAILQEMINRTQPASITSGHASLKFINTAPQHQAFVNFSNTYLELAPSQSSKDIEERAGNVSVSVRFNDTGPARTFYEQLDGTKSYTVFLNTGSPGLALIELNRQIRPTKSQSEWRIVNALDSSMAFVFNSTDGMQEQKGVINDTFGFNKELMLKQGTYSLYVTVKGRTISLGAQVTETGSINTVVVRQESNSTKAVVYQDITPNEIHMLWQIPQYFVITCGEALFSVTGLSFSYTQAPPTMKAVLQAAWLMTNAIGNIIVVVVVKGVHLGNRAHEFYLFAGLMYATIIVFALMSWTYIYVDKKDNDEGDEEADNPDVKPAAGTHGQTTRPDGQHNKGFEPDHQNLELSGIVTSSTTKEHPATNQVHVSPLSSNVPSETQPTKHEDFTVDSDAPTEALSSKTENSPVDATSL